MPLYEYRCKKCKRTFEVLQKISAEPLKDCLYCSGNVEKLISVSSFQFKGSGWYITDYKNKNSNSDPGPKKTIKNKKNTTTENKAVKNKNEQIK